MTITGGITRTDLDEALGEVAALVDQGRECGYDSDPAGEHRALGAARALLARLDEQLADRVDELGQR